MADDAPPGEGPEPGAPARRRARAGTPPVQITDPAALRALAHPARQRVIDLLHDHDAPLTATQAAAACGLTPSAMSYHLRALERWGIVERDEATTDGRERPWRAVGSSLSVGPPAFVGVPPDQMTAYLTAFLAPLTEASTRFAHTLAAQDPDAPETGNLARYRLWLRPEEYAELRARLHDAVAPYQDRSAENHPQDARPYDDYLILLPADESGPPEAPGRRLPQQG